MLSSEDIGKLVSDKKFRDMQFEHVRRTNAQVLAIEQLCRREACSTVEMLKVQVCVLQAMLAHANEMLLMNQQKLLAAKHIVAEVPCTTTSKD